MGTPRSKFWDVIRDRAWQFVGVVVAVVLGVVALIYTNDDDKSPVPPQQNISVDGVFEGDCIANGVNNVLNNCKALGPSMTDISVADKDVSGVWFDGPPEALPSPPAHIVGRKVGCRDDQYREWLRETEGFYFYDIEKTVTLTAGDPDLVTLTAATVTIADRKEISMSEGTLITCNWGGGGFTESYMIEVDSQAQQSTLFDVLEAPPENPRPMPPGRVSMDTKSAVEVSIGVKSRQNHAYQGSVTLTASVNGKQVEVNIGPLRWVENNDPVGGKDSYALDEQGRWTLNWSPF
ncbi:hypothetical protein V6V47_17650 [Micromonospora sp. CPCC 205539]|uniref:hypothetical protein n=1 Tax=Micromonospora sp. CPCC 205539 TaxID=3122408 RepID=UPI002FF3F116